MGEYHAGLGEAIEYAAEHLAVDWAIEIVVEQGAGWIRLEDPRGKEIPFDLCDMSMAEQVMHGVELSQRRTKNC